MISKEIFIEPLEDNFLSNTGLKEKISKLADI